MSLNLLAQFIGVIAVCVSVAIFQSDNRLKMLKLAIVVSVLYTVHFYLLGALTGAAMNLIGAIRCYVFFKIKPGHHDWWALALFTAMAMFATALTWQGPLSLLPLIGSVCYGVALWHKEPNQIRRWSMMSPPLWFIYDGISGSYPGMLIESLVLMSSLVGEIRFDRKHISHLRHWFMRPA